MDHLIALGNEISLVHFQVGVKLMHIFALSKWSYLMFFQVGGILHHNFQENDGLLTETLKV